MKEKNKSLFDKEKNILKSAGVWYKEDALIKPKTVLIIGIIATITDGLTIYLTLDPLLKTMVVLTLLLTFTASTILDVFPAYWPYAFEKIKTYAKADNLFFSKLIKAFLVISIAMWGFVMVSICLVRYSAMEYILLNTIQESIVAQQDTDLYQPQFTTFMGQVLMTFMNFVNIATSACVLLASMVSFIPYETKKRNKKIMIETSLGEIIADKQQELDQLNAVINDSTVHQLEDETHAVLYDIANSEADMKCVEAREDLARFLSDADVDVKITMSSQQIV